METERAKTFAVSSWITLGDGSAKYGIKSEVNQLQMKIT